MGVRPVTSDALAGFAAEVGPAGRRAGHRRRRAHAVGASGGARRCAPRPAQVPGAGGHRGRRGGGDDRAGAGRHHGVPSSTPPSPRSARPSRCRRGPGATVGGVLAVGHSGLRRLGWGPVRDALLRGAGGLGRRTLVKAGGPTVKNVTGFDLCRLLVGSLGTLGAHRRGGAAHAARCRQSSAGWRARPTRSPWSTALHRPAAVLWDGTTTWVLLDGHPDDVDAQAGARRSGRRRRSARPPVPPHRWSLRPVGAAGAADRLGSRGRAVRRRGRRGRRPRRRPRRAARPSTGGGRAAPPDQGRVRPDRPPEPRPRPAPGGRARWTSASSTTSWPAASRAGCACPTARPTG